MDRTDGRLGAYLFYRDPVFTGRRPAHSLRGHRGGGRGSVRAARMYHLQLYRHRSRLAGRFLYRQSSRLSRRRMARGKRDARFVAFEDQGQG